MKQQKNLIKKIKQKKELSGISDKLISELLASCLSKYNLSAEKLSNPQQKIIVKEIRAKLRTFTGQFQKSFKNRSKLLEKNDFKKIILTHTSTAERIDFYPKLKTIIKKLKINSMLDIGCGLNPLILSSPKIKYYAADIREDELNLIRKFFKIKKIKGKTFFYDLANPSTALPKADICLLLKVLDIVDKKHRLTEKILKSIPCKKLLVSFSTKKLSGRYMNFPKRIWFEKLLKRLNLQYKEIKSPNEIFYLIDLRQE